jgi:hypothetical protein
VCSKYFWLYAAQLYQVLKGRKMFAVKGLSGVLCIFHPEGNIAFLRGIPTIVDY